MDKLEYLSIIAEYKYLESIALMLARKHLPQDRDFDLTCHFDEDGVRVSVMEWFGESLESYNESPIFIPVDDLLKEWN